MDRQRAVDGIRRKGRGGGHPWGIICSKYTFIYEYCRNRRPFANLMDARVRHPSFGDKGLCQPTGASFQLQQDVYDDFKDLSAQSLKNTYKYIVCIVYL